MFGRVAVWLRRKLLGFAYGDLVLAALLCAVAVASVLTGNPYEGPVAVTLPVAIASTVALAWRTRSPVVTVVIVLAADVAQLVFAEQSGSLWSLVVLAITMYSLAAHYTEGRAAILGVLMVVTILIEEKVSAGQDYLFIILLFGGLWLLGRASRLWRGRVTRAEQHEQDLARIAVADERVRIARELHDVVAHSLSVIALQADAAGAALETDPTRAREPLQVINTTARNSLGEIREILHLLRADSSELRPTPGLAALDDLLQTAKDAGLDISARVHLGEKPIPPVVDLAAYRILQEALTNAARHAGAVSVALEVRVTGEAVELSVENAGGAAARKTKGAGVGLVGIRERVNLLGGSLDAAPIPGGGFRLAARLPLEGRPA
ncbi:MAG: sensor histidine kinase [Cryobacterium sp.]|nr:sensor histidine kinase [Cryobacterium sp.]